MINKPKNAELIQNLIKLGDLARKRGRSFSSKGMSKEEAKEALHAFLADGKCQLEILKKELREKDQQKAQAS